MRTGTLALECHDLLVVSGDFLLRLEEELRPPIISGGHLGVLQDGTLPFGGGPLFTCSLLPGHPRFSRAPLLGDFQSFCLSLLELLGDFLKCEGGLGGDEAALDRRRRGLNLGLVEHLNLDGG